MNGYIGKLWFYSSLAYLQVDDSSCVLLTPPTNETKTMWGQEDFDICANQPSRELTKDEQGVYSKWYMKLMSEHKDKSSYIVTRGSSVSDGSTAEYYKLPEGATQLQDLISHRNMNAQIGEILRACYRYGQASHSDQLRDAKKIKFYIEAEIARLEKQ